ncbi:putative Rab GTPase-binding protein SRO77 [Maudiozyma barnettii]|uniref:Similar to Saccharomyces cerevisiae YBL106C SRO77 Protein with roles in exocytosis and cation homeostasis n=1 Tax=Maudiozyma barnettii TaxID=61262 RepID=A0A8H2VIK5_9SACH|nr:putative Rab GTPase-binding protein SRO77 [Kazachstania barnettii]CAB4255914.1 similar to Saccharomyces cerevisiae YBL106C SRO77 Protein with roles in exocytosis and cation homeostasis [Kazachstania barnettii]
MFKSDRFKKVSQAFKSPKSGGSANRSASSSPIVPSSSDGKFKSVSSSIKKVSPISQSPDAKLFNSHVVKYSGIKGKIIAYTFDFTQSLMAVATDLNEIHVFGQGQVEVVFTLSVKGAIRTLNFVKGIYLVAIDSKDTLLVLSLYSKKVLASVFIPSHITCVETDPGIDWILLGLQNGAVMVYDVDRNSFSGVTIENLQKSEFFPKEIISPVISVRWNPRDLGNILISYNYVTVVYSLVEMEIKQSFVYELPPFAPGGGNSDKKIDTNRKPKVVQSLYHPNSLHILTVHEDNSMVFWDANTGHLIEARTLFETDVNIPNPKREILMDALGSPQIFKVYWICMNNPEYTSLLIATKSLARGDTSQGITILDLGGTPLYSITSYDAMQQYYASPKHQKLCPLVNRAPLVDILPLPRASAHFGGCHDPAFVLALLDDGEMETLLVQSGSFTSKASLLSQSLSWTRPIVTTSTAFSVPKKLWLGLMSTYSTVNESILKGGNSSKKGMRPSEIRTAIATGHTNGSVRIWDGAQNELDDKCVFEVNVGRVVNRALHLSICKIHFAAETLELAVATEQGEVILYKFEMNQFFKDNKQSSDAELDMMFRRFSLEDSKDILVDVRDRAPPNVKQGFMPSTVINAKRGEVTALYNSNIGFVAIAYSSGALIIVDRRGPAAIYMGQVGDIPKIRGTCITSINISIMEYSSDGYSSILMYCGTDSGELITYKILPSGSGRFSVDFVAISKTNDGGPIINISSYAMASGGSCEGTIMKMQELTRGSCVTGYVIVTGKNDIRIVKPGKSKEDHKSYRHPIVASDISYILNYGSKGEARITTFLVVVLSNATVKVLSLPDLKEVKSMDPPTPVSSHYITETAVIKNGDVFMRIGKYLSVLLSIVNEQSNAVPGSPTLSSNGPVVDTLYNPNLKITYRPQVNSLQWARGTVYCTPEQLALVLGGENRPDSRYKESAIAAGTLSTEPHSSEHAYQKPIRHANKHNAGYGYMRGISRTVETHWDNIETQFNDYATATGQAMNDAMEQTGKDIVKGSFGL